MIATGLAVVALSMVLRAAFTVSSGYGAILISQCLFAVGMGLTIPPATASIMGPCRRSGPGWARP